MSDNKKKFLHLASSGVLQKFKKTFSHFKNGKTTVPVGDESSDAKHHR